MTDPRIEYSTYLAGSQDDIGEVHPAVDDEGHAVICGGTDSSDYPVTPGAFQPALSFGFDAFITKVNDDGSDLIYSTYLGGTGTIDDAVACAVDALGNVYVVGLTNSSDFPVTPGAFQGSFAGGDGSFCPDPFSDPWGQPTPCDGFVAKFGPDGSLIYSTYVGGTGNDWLIGVQVDRLGNVLAVGDTSSADFPTTPGALQGSNAGGTATICFNPCDEVLLKFDPSGSLVYSTYLGGPGDDCCQPGLALDARGNAYLVGATTSRHFPTTRGAFRRHYVGGSSDLYVAKIDPSGSHLLYATYLGGARADPFADSVTVDPSGNAYVAGVTASVDFPVTAHAFQTAFGGGLIDGFVTKLNARGSALVWSTYLGGSGDEGTGDPQIDAAGHVFVITTTSSLDYPITPDAFQSVNLGGAQGEDGAVTEVTRDGSGLVFSTYWGGTGDDGVNGAVLDRERNLYLTGCTSSLDFPTSDDAYQDAFQGGGDKAFFACWMPPGSDNFVTKFSFGSDDQAKPVLRGDRGGSPVPATPYTRPR